jgi:prephenate dehydrogenase
MGTWFATFLKENGYQVIIHDKNKRAATKLVRRKGFRLAGDQQTAIAASQLVVLATPSQTTKRILEQISHALSSQALLVEISSVKEPLKAVLHKLRKRNIPILSIHPMFGPGARTIRDRTVFITSLPPRNIQADRLLSTFRKNGARLVQCSLQEHDKLVSALLTLPHFMNMIMVSTLKSTLADPNQLRELSGTTFKLQLLIAEAIHMEDPENEASILTGSHQSLKLLQKYVQESSAALRAMREGKRDEIIKNLRSGRRFLKTDKMFAHAYEAFNAAVAASVH